MREAQVTVPTPLLVLRYHIQIIENKKRLHRHRAKRRVQLRKSQHCLIVLEYEDVASLRKIFF